MADDALSEANKIALELGDKSKSSESSNTSSNSTYTRTVVKAVPKKVVVVKKKKGKKVVVVKKKTSAKSKSRKVLKEVPYEETSLVEIAEQEPVVNNSTVTVETTKTYAVEDNGPIVNPLSDPKGGLIETLGGLAMILIGIEIVIIILLLLFALFK